MKKEFSIVALTISSLMFPLSAEASNFSKINVFGDSLVDTGNVFNLTGVPPSPPYFEGRFSNEEIWIDIVAESFDLDLTLSSELGTTIPTNGINFAFGGATTGSNNVIEGFPFGLQQQVEVFEDLTATQPADADALNIIWAGANDYFLALSDPSSLTPSLAEQTTDNLSSAVQSLYEAGAREFLVVNLPDIGNTPLIINETENVVPGISSQLNSLTGLHNTLLNQKLSTLDNQLSGVDITILDSNSLFENIITNPSQFGFTNVSDSCLINSQLLPNFSFDGVCDNPSEFVFWDDIHPSGATHQLIGQLAIETLQAKEQVPEANNVINSLGLWTILSLLWLKKKSSIK